MLTALSELYDHIVFDTAPLLPVSDTHVLCGMVDGVICSFNAEVDRDTVKMVEEILRRSRANLIGTVMNQVKLQAEQQLSPRQNRLRQLLQQPARRNRRPTRARRNRTRTLRP